MAAFLRRRTSKKPNAKPTTPTPTPKPVQSAPPTLPPLILTSFSDAEPTTPTLAALPPAASPPVPVLVPVPVSEPDVVHWDPWDQIRIDINTNDAVQPPRPGNTQNRVRRAAVSSSSPSPPPPPTVLPGRKFDFEEALSAANVTSVANPPRMLPKVTTHHDALLINRQHVAPPRKSFAMNTSQADLPPLARKSSKISLLDRDPAPSDHPRHRVLLKPRPSTPHRPLSQSVPGDPLLLDKDPFACVEGVRVLKTRLRSNSRTSSSSREDLPLTEDAHVPPLPCPPADPPDDYKAARQLRRGLWLEKAPPPVVAEVIAKQLSTIESPREPTPPPTYFPITLFLSHPHFLTALLAYLSYSDWLALYSTNKPVRDIFHNSRILRECVLERFLATVGYVKWNYEWAEPLALSLKDLHNYLRGVAMPTHDYARLSTLYLRPKDDDLPATYPDILTLALTTRAYTRLVLRLRAQAESEARYLKTLHPTDPPQPFRPATRLPSLSSRAPSPTSSHSHSRHHSRDKVEHSPTSSSSSSSSSSISRFRSPLYRPGRAPVLRVFVPSPEGDWLSDASVVECEAELKRSGVLKLLRAGDVVWDTAVGDEGNLGRLIWDGNYLVDLDYRYSRVGELSPYFHSLAFSPSFFHRVIRIGGSAAHNPHCNPIVYIDISPWGHDIAASLQLLQDRARTETPHGALHDVVRWVHRATFTIRPPPSAHTARARNLRVPIPNTVGFFIDPGWYGSVVVESEGTNEGLADLQARCGPGVFPPRAETLATKMRNEKDKENRRVWRILREKSRPGEIWLRAVHVKERMM